MKTDMEAPPLGAVDASAERARKLRERFKVNSNPNFFSNLLFFFVGPLIRLGMRVRLEEEDLINREDMATKVLHDRFENAWEQEKKKEKPRILRAVLSGGWMWLILTGMMYAVSLLMSFAGPLLLNKIVGGLSCRQLDGSLDSEGNVVEEDCPTSSELYRYTLGLFIAPLIQALAESHLFFQLNLYGTRLRNALMAAIYRKCLKLSSSAVQESSTGKIVTLMSNDAQKVQDAMLAVHALWGSPIMIAIILTLLYGYVGWSTFVGLGVMLLLVPVTAKTAKSLGTLRRDLVKWTDKRVGIVSEVISGIRVIKFYAWENSFLKRIQACRSEEGSILKNMAKYQSMFAMLLFMGPVFVAVGCFGSYTAAGNVLSTADAYTALAFFTILRLPLSFLPMFITMAVNAMVGLKRIQAFLTSSEVEDFEDESGSKTEPGHVQVTAADFKWDSKAEVSTIRNLSFSAQPGSLTMVVGSVGCGKSSLLSALIKHIPRVKGDVKVGGKIAYVAQSAWIINETLRENVVMGQEFDQEKYDQALEVSQMGPDLAILPKGELTEIGERGVTLSGGQKQRVSVARAMYYDADVYLFDDPLSAVDAHVGKALFEGAIKGVLKEKTVLLVTNALHYLPFADQIIWLEDGAAKAVGNYQDILDAGFDPTSVLSDSSVGKVGELADPKTDAGMKKVDSRSKSLARMTSIPERGAVEELESTDSGSGSEDVDDSAKMDKPPLSKYDSAASAALVEATKAPETGETALKGVPRKSDSASSGVLIEMTNPPSGKGGGKKVEGGKKGAGKPAASKELTGVEEREAGAIGKEVLSRYTLAAGGTVAVVLLAILFTSEQGSKIITDRWVGLWAVDSYNQSIGFYFGIYGALGVAFGVFVYVRTLHFAYSHVRASLQMHSELLHHILKLPMQFFDTNPSGRIVNRFSRDMDIMDTTLFQSLVQFAGCIANFFGILVVICIATPWFTLALVPITTLYFVIQRSYIPSGRELQRLESISRSPIYTGFGEAVNGISTIRAYDFGGHFVRLSDAKIEKNAAAYVTQKAASGWLSTRLDLIGLITLTLAGVLAVQGSISPALAGLSLVYALDLTKFLKHGTNMASKTESDFNSVERIVQYLKPEREGHLKIEDGNEPEAEKPKNWPSHGGISIKNVAMRYRSDTPLVLRGISLDVKPGEKIGIAGRTGSGKSSFFLALYRMVTLEEGSIEIDGVDISQIKLSTLRSSMSMIPQDPFMFSGTVRHNLDPFEEYSDLEVWQALESVGLKPSIESYPEKLSAPVVDSGGNFSQGQRQLFCLARALLRKAKILMMDEATASVDLETDALIQRTIRDKMQDVTVLTIAHRINTIVDSDRVLVMDDGEVGEFDTPSNLLKNRDGLFAQLVLKSQKTERGLLGSATFKIGSRSSESESVQDVSGEEEEVEASRNLPRSASNIGLVGSSALRAMSQDE